jgi:hypothetical protein
MFESLSPARRRTLIWLAVGALTLVLIAAGLGSFTFQPGKTFSQPKITIAPSSAVGAGGSSDDSMLLTVIRGVLGLALLMLPVSLIFALLTKEGRRRLLTNVILAILLLLVAGQIKETQKRAQEKPPLEISNGLQAGEKSGEPLPPLPPKPSDEFVLITSVGLVVVGLSLAVWLGRGLLFKRQVPTLAKIGAEAERARSALADGGAFEDAVLRAYRQMSRIVADARKLKRSQAMTAREFETYLAQAGLPDRPVQVLTRLFEDVRYGGLVPGAPERQAAIDSLSAIAAACRKEES